MHSLCRMPPDRPPQCLLEVHPKWPGRKAYPISSHTDTTSSLNLQALPDMPDHQAEHLSPNVRVCSSVDPPLQCNFTLHCASADPQEQHSQIRLQGVAAFVTEELFSGSCRAVQPSKKPLLCPFQVPRLVPLAMSPRSSLQRLPWMPPMRCQKQRVTSVPFCFGRTRDISTFLFQAPPVAVFNPLQPRACSRALAVTCLAAFSRSLNTSDVRAWTDLQTLQVPVGPSQGGHSEVRRTPSMVTPGPGRCTSSCLRGTCPGAPDLLFQSRSRLHPGPMLEDMARAYVAREVFRSDVPELSADCVRQAVSSFPSTSGAPHIL